VNSVAEEWRLLAEFVGFSIAVPSLLYLLMTHHLSVDGLEEQVLAIGLGFGGLIAFSVCRWRF
jgi:hypothetical protein